MLEEDEVHQVEKVAGVVEKEPEPDVLVRLVLVEEGPKGHHPGVVQETYGWTQKIF